VLRIDDARIDDTLNRVVFVGTAVALHITIGLLSSSRGHGVQVAFINLDASTR
jgi:hypothetical protein